MGADEGKGIKGKERGQLVRAWSWFTGSAEGERVALEGRSPARLGRDSRRENSREGEASISVAFGDCSNF